MNEVGSLEEKSIDSAAYKEPSIAWEKGGQTLFVGFSLLAAAPFASPSLRKRRFSLGAVNTEASLPPIVEEFFPARTEKIPSYPPRTSFHEEHIRAIFTAMGTQGYLALWAMEAELEARGKAIESLHPFRLLGFLFSDPQLKNYIKVVMNDLWMQPRFLKGIEEGMKKELKQNNVAPHIEAFAQEVKMPAQSLRPSIEDRAWKQLIHRLIEESGGPRGQRFPE
jgi:hypothetical protein